MRRMLSGDDLEPGTWRYAIIKHTEEHNGETHVYYTVGEVFAPNDFLGWSEHNLPGYTTKEQPFGETPEELLANISQMLMDVDVCVQKGLYVDDKHCESLPKKELDWDELTKDAIPAEQVFAKLREKFGDLDDVDPDDDLATE